MGYLTTTPTSNEQPKERKTKYGPDGEYVDDFCALLNYLAKRCQKCKLVIMNKHLDKKQLCPDCR